MKNDNVLVSFINDNVLLTEEELAFVINLFEYISYQKGQQIKGIDEVCSYTYLLIDGVVRQFQIFNNIPTKVTLNEYIEISKFYSTPKSHTFINGVLDKAIDRLTKDNKIQKVGRGLIS